MSSGKTNTSDEDTKKNNSVIELNVVCKQSHRNPIEKTPKTQQKQAEDFGTYQDQKNISATCLQEHASQT